MRKIFYPIIAFYLLSLAGCEPTKNNSYYRIVGTIENSSDGDTVMLQADNDQNLVELERTYIRNGQFVFTGRQDSTVERIITYIKNGVKMGAVFFLENGNIKMKLDETTSITGTKNNDKYQEFLNKINGIYGQMSSVNDILVDSTDSDSLHTDLNQKVNSLDEKANKLIIETIKENIDNPIGFYLFRRYNYLIPPKLQYFLISKMPASWRRTPSIDDIKTQLNLLPQDSLSSLE
jgi:hypothetical protein